MYHLVVGCLAAVIAGVFIWLVENAWYYLKNGCLPSDDDPTYTEED